MNGINFANPFTEFDVNIACGERGIMLLLKCCGVSWFAFVDSTFPEHFPGRFAKFIPSPVWSLLVEYIF